MLTKQTHLLNHVAKNIYAWLNWPLGTAARWSRCSCLSASLRWSFPGPRWAPSASSGQRWLGAQSRTSVRTGSWSGRGLLTRCPEEKEVCSYKDWKEPTIDTMGSASTAVGAPACQLMAHWIQASQELGFSSSTFFPNFHHFSVFKEVYL